MWDRLTDVIKGTVELNLKFTSTLLNVSTDYVKNVHSILTEGASASPTPTPPPQPIRPPLLIVGQLNETPSAAFPLNNHADKDVQVTLMIQGQLTEKQVTLSPASVTLKAGGSTIVQIRAHIDETLEPNVDFHGSVAAPGLSTQCVDFVVRRLPGETPQPVGATPVEPVKRKRTAARRKK